MRALCPPGSLLTWKSLPPRALPVWPVCVSICGAVAARRPGGQGLCLLLLPSCRVATRGQSSQDGRSALSPAAKAQTGESLCLNTPVRFHWAMNTACRGSLRARTALTTVPSEHVFPCNWRPEGRTSSEAVLRPGDPGPPLLLSALACRPAARTRLPCAPVRSPCRGSAAWDALTCHSDPDWAPASPPPRASATCLPQGHTQAPVLSAVPTGWALFLCLRSVPCWGSTICWWTFAPRAPPGSITWLCGDSELTSAVWAGG